METENKDVNIQEKSLAMEILVELKGTIKRLWILILILIGVLVASNFYWLYTFTQYDFISYDQSAEGGGNANIITGDGDITNGEAESQNKNQEGQ